MTIELYSKYWQIAKPDIPLFSHDDRQIKFWYDKRLPDAYSGKYDWTKSIHLEDFVYNDDMIVYISFLLNSTLFWETHHAIVKFPEIHLHQQFLKQLWFRVTINRNFKSIIGNWILQPNLRMF